jgi:hypothetical protein
MWTATLIPRQTDIIHCTLHGFDFMSIGDPKNLQRFASHGMLAIHFETLPISELS